MGKYLGEPSRFIAQMSSLGDVYILSFYYPAFILKTVELSSLPENLAWTKDELSRFIADGDVSSENLTSEYKEILNNKSALQHSLMMQMTADFLKTKKPKNEHPELISFIDEWKIKKQSNSYEEK